MFGYSIGTFTPNIEEQHWLLSRPQRPLRYNHELLPHYTSDSSRVSSDRADVTPKSTTTSRKRHERHPEGVAEVNLRTSASSIPRARPGLFFQPQTFQADPKELPKEPRRSLLSVNETSIETYLMPPHVFA